MKVALVHDFLKEYGGAERVLEALHEIYPKAPVFTAFVDFKGLGPHAKRIKKWNIIESWVGKNWLVKKLHSPLRFLTPLVWEFFDFSEFDVVISSSGWYISRGIITKPNTLHICYLHHPPRHLYNYQTARQWQKYLPVKIYGYLVNHYLRMYDYLASQRVDYFIANSRETQKRIKKFYRRDSKVIYPPATPSQARLAWRAGPSAHLTFQGQALERESNYFLCVGRLAKAKHIDLAIKACNKLGCELWVVGGGREEKYLRSIAGAKINFLGEVKDKQLPKIYKKAKALIFPAEDEEFGIVPVEAMSFGIPVIAYKSGGVKETIIEGKTGFFFDELSVDSLISVVKHFNNIYHSKRSMREISGNCLKRAKEFSKEKFKKQIVKFIEKKHKEYSSKEYKRIII